MKVIDDVKKSLGTNILRSKIQKQTRDRSFFNFESAHSIGVLFDASHQESYLMVKYFIESLRTSKTEVHGLGYVLSHDALNFFPYHKGIDFFCIKDVKWQYEPKSAVVEKFYSHQMDIFIDLTFEDSLTLKYISGQANAKLKIGHGKEDDRDYDFVINMKQDKSLDNLLNQIKHYMSIIKIKK